MIACLALFALAAMGPDAGTPPRALTPEEVLAAHPLGPDHWAKLDDADRAATLEAIHQRPIAERLLAVSRRFLDTPYVHSPLGEGWGKDADPPLRYDALDCLTFVEETIALSLVTGADVQPTLQRLRYFHQPTYEDRNHLMEAEWLPHNIEKGFLRDVTARYGGADARTETKIITRSSWQSDSARALDLPKEREPIGTFPIRIVPLEKVLEKAPSIPSGTVAVVVREERLYKVTRVTHLGFIVQKHGRPYLRHASSAPFGRVIDEDLESFLSRNSQYEKWKVVGLSLYEVLAPKVARTAAR